MLYEAFFKTYTEKVWGISCREISQTWATQRIKGLNLPKAILNAFTQGRFSGIKTLVDRFIYFDLGAGSPYEFLCRSVVAAGGAFQPREEVTEIHHDGQGTVTRVVSLAGGERREYAAPHFVSTMPITELVRRMVPALPADVLDAANRLRYRTHISVNLLVEGNPFPDNWIYVHSPEVRVGRIANYRNFSARMCPRETATPLTFEYFVFDGDPIETLPDEALIDLAKTEGRRIGLLTDLPVSDAFVVRSRHAYCVIQTGYEQHVARLQACLGGFRNLATAGRAGMFKYNNQDHSIMTGLMAADNILGANLDIWAVNIDAEYHESGSAPDLCEEDRVEPMPPAPA